MNTSVTVDPKKIAEEYKLLSNEETAPFMTPSNLNELANSKTNSSATIAAQGSLASMLFYVQGKCIVSNGKMFSGKAWGVSFPGGGALYGDIYLNAAQNLDQLYAETVSWSFLATPVYTTFSFYDANKVLLANFQAGSVSRVSGVGSGSGSWS